MTESKVEPTAAMTGRRRALVIVNARARNGGTVLDGPLAVLADGGLETERRTLAPGENPADVIRALAADGFDRIIVGGGDGTLSAAAPAIVASGLPFGILPLGTANDLARSLGIPADLDQAASVIAAGRLRPIDLGAVNDRLFFNVASIGFSAALPGELTAGAKRRWGTLGYAIAAIRLLHRIRPFTAWIDHDGITATTRGIQVSVGNGRNYGGGLTVASEATLDDGVFHIYSLETDRWWRLLGLVPYLRAGTQGQWPDVGTWRTSECTLRTRRPMKINADGEIAAETPARFRVIRQAVQVFAPPPPTP